MIGAAVVLTCTAPAAEAGLTTAERVRQHYPGIGATDEALADFILDASALVAAHLNWRHADDEAMPLAVQSYEEAVVAPEHCVIGTSLHLSRAPIRTVASLTVDGVAIDPETLSIARRAGAIRLAAGSEFGSEVAVAYDAGWVLPGEEGRDLPRPIELATILMVRRERIAAGDPDFEATIKAESVPGVGSLTYAVPDERETPDGMPTSVARMLAPFRRQIVA